MAALVQKAIQTDLGVILRNVPKPYNKDVQLCYDRLIQSNNQGIAALKALRDKNYPQSFLTVKPITPDFSYFDKYVNTTEVALPTSIDPSQLTYDNLISVDLDQIKNEPFYDHLGISSVTIEGKETVPVNQWLLTVSKTPNLSWYSTRFKVNGILPLSTIQHTYHPFFEAYLNANRIYLSRSGNLNAQQISPATFTYVFNSSKVPYPGALITDDQYRFDYYTETTTQLAPEYSQLAGSPNEAVQFEMTSPPTLLYLKSYVDVWKKESSLIEYVTTGPVETRSTENGPSLSSGNPAIGDNVLALKTWAYNNVRLNYEVRLDEKTRWSFNLAIHAPVEEGKYYTIKSRQNLRYLTADGTGLNQMEPPLNIYSYWQFLLNGDGSYRIKSVPSNRYIDVNGASTADDTPLILFKPLDALNQSWKIQASPSGDGWSTFTSMMATKPPKRITSKNSILRAFSYAANNQLDQDWLIEPVKPNGARVTSQLAQVKRVEEGILPTLQPNPATDQVQLNLPSGYEQSEISISTINGASLTLPIQIQQNKRLIDVRQLPTGMYLLRVQSKNKPQRVMKFMKK
ncbi:RICIN domain-containing protein [Larkinella sp. GY13]|uniref:RICIN domain-containing protein n=1 Tax=Larkinella sp. GY13 TaxID=3453720 RepID=UPI003EEA81CD